MVNFIKWAIAIIITIIILGVGLWLISRLQQRDELPGPPEIPDQVNLPIGTNLSQCQNAPFILPTEGWIGILYGDSIFGTQNHSGLDIFSMAGNGVTPVYAAYDGYLTRLPEWVSAVIIRHPQDPLTPGRQIWTYYTHMGNSAGNSYVIDQIPPGTVELPVKKGTLLGYQGDYNGQSWRSIDTHLHFSIVLDDGQGRFRNETDLANTIDPSPYLGMRLNVACGDRPPVCRPDFLCP